MIYFIFFVYFWNIQNLHHTNQKYSTWKGKAFELFFSSRIEELKEMIGILNVKTQHFLNWDLHLFGKPIKTKMPIDLLIRHKNDFWLVECKFYQSGIKKFTLNEMDRLMAKAENVQYIYGDDVNVNIILLGCNPIHFPQREYPFPVQSLLWHQE